MTEYSCYAINGLMEQAFGNPLTALAEYLNQNTPTGIHFNVVGGVDPRPPVQASIFNAVIGDIKAGKTVIVIGHSLGAGACYYLADTLKAQGLGSPLFAAIDPTQWGSNVPPDPQWALQPAHPGRWQAPDNIGIFLNFHQPLYPGGGICISGGDDILVPGVGHIEIPNAELTRGTILNAIGRVIKNG